MAALQAALAMPEAASLRWSLLAHSCPLPAVQELGLSPAAGLCVDGGGAALPVSNEQAAGDGRVPTLPGSNQQATGEGACGPQNAHPGSPHLRPAAAGDSSAEPFAEREHGAVAAVLAVERAVLAATPGGHANDRLEECRLWLGPGQAPTLPKQSQPDLNQRLKWTNLSGVARSRHAKVLRGASALPLPCFELFLFLSRLRHIR